MIFTITNSSLFDATNVIFSDDLGVFVSGSTSIGLPTSDVCGAGSSISGATLITLSNGTIPANSSCQFTVMVHIPEETPSGTYLTVTSPITADISGSNVIGGAASSGSGTLVIVGVAILIPVLNNWLIILFMSLILLLVGWYQVHTREV
jgi:hypothetical protein